ncbi:MAG: protein TonB, partial [Rhodothermales bacterium]
MNDSFAVALMLALSLHAAILLVLSFAFDINPLQKAVETLDVVLVNWRSEKAPEEADYLAQASQIGGGESNEASKPSQNFSSAIPTAGEGDMPEQLESQLPSETLESMPEVISANPDSRPVQQVTRVEQEEKDLPSAAE